jgi:osmotically-inducible protein OsmY
MKTLKLKEWAKRAAIGRWSASLLIAAGIQTLVLPSLQAATTEKEITDSGITTAVEGGLKLDKGVFPNDVDVSTSQGIVTLSGSVNNLLAKERAVMAAKSIRGVREVIDKITVTPVSRSDEDIRKDIQTALQQDPATESYQTTVSVQGAVATLTGSVGTYAEKQLATRIANGVKGVKEVRNDVTINYMAKRTDSEIAADVKARLQWDIWINGGLISPVVKGGKVTLTGTIGSVISKSRAFDDAWVNGVTSVDDSGLKIESLAHNDAQQKSKTAISSDSEIKQAVQAALRFDARVSAFSPDVTVEDGVVILGGSVGNLKAKTAAAQDAKNVVGVSLVENHLKVRPTGGSADAAAMEKQLKAALLWDPFLDSSTIDVAVNRVAYLSGAVDSSFQKAEAQDVASRIKGVVQVRNHLKVEPEYYSIYDSDYDYYNGYYYPDYDYGYYDDYGYYGSPDYNQSPYYISEMSGPQPYLSDEQIKKNIENRFFWSPFVDSDDIKVTVDGAVATLTGTVGTWVGWGEADKDARKGGATAVLNRVTVNKGHWW